LKISNCNLISRNLILRLITARQESRALFMRISNIIKILMINFRSILFEQLYLMIMSWKDKNRKSLT